MERTAKKKDYYNQAVGRIPVPFEDGHITIRECADAELKEEVGIDRSLVRATIEFGCMDSAFNDPRAHYIRHIFLRWVETPPKSSAELKNVFAIPLSQLPVLINRSQKLSIGNTALELQLNHDKLLELVLSTPFAKAFVDSIMHFYDQPTGALTYGLGGAQVF